MEKRLDTADIASWCDTVKVGERILLSGTVYTARDAAHKRLAALMAEGAELPFPLENAVIYYAGPTPAKHGLAVGSCGPTTSSRMDVYTPRMLEGGLRGMIGKGMRSPEVIESMVRHRAVYLCALGGAGALACRSITSCGVVAFPELGCESVKRLTLCDFPLIVGIDTMGHNIYDRCEAL